VITYKPTKEEKETVRRIIDSFEDVKKTKEEQIKIWDEAHKQFTGEKYKITFIDYVRYYWNKIIEKLML